MTEPNYRRLERRIREQIASGALKPGDRLPSTRTFRERYGIGNDTVLRAMDRLVHDKVIVTHRGLGRYVWPGPPDLFADPPGDEARSPG